MTAPDILAIPAEEIDRQFGTNARQDVKIIVPELLTAARTAFLEAMGRPIKPERLMTESVWRHAADAQTNAVVTADSLPHPGGPATGPFSLGFANAEAVQVTHYHRHQTEIFYSAHRIDADYRHRRESGSRHISLLEGGALIVFPEIIHRVALVGLTLIIGVPAAADDKTLADL